MNCLKIVPHWNEPGHKLRHTWEGLVNIDQFRWFVRRDVQEQLKLAHDEIGARHVRAVGMFDDELRFFRPGPESFLTKKSDCRPNLQIIDYIMDSLVDIGISPMFTTTFMPTELASGTKTVFTTKGNVTLPRRMEEWSELVTHAASHAVNRYGIEAVRTWYFEVWNEPNLRGFFDGEQKDFFALWQATYRAIKRVDKGLRVGGPSTARAEWIADLIEFGQKHDCPPDYIITHIYNNDSESNPLSPFDGPQEDRQSKSPMFAAGVVRGVRKLLDEMKYNGEVHWNEWGRSWYPCYPERETAAEAGFICKTMAQVSQLADYFAYWCLSDIYDQVGYGREAFHGNYGMLSLQGLRKPSYHAHQLLAMLGQTSHPVSCPEAPEGFGALATSGDKHHVLIYAYHQSTDPVSRRTVSVMLPAGIQPERLKLYAINSTENNILNQWREMGAPDYLSREQTAYLRSKNTLQASSHPIEVRDGSAVFTFESPGAAVFVIE